MATWIQSLAWALIYAPIQGLLVYTALSLVLKLLPASSSVRYHMALSALMALLLWFTGTWIQQYQQLSPSLSGTMPPAAVHQPLPAEGKTAVTVYKNTLSLVQQAAPWLSAFYIIGLAFMVVRLSGGLLQLFSFRKTGISQPGEHLRSMLISLKNKLHIDKKVQFFISAKAGVPMVIGFLKPVILLPAAAMTQLSAGQLESILLHELAHIKRHDYLVNILQTVAETIMFFNPFAWMISGMVRREREHCCDDLVLLHTNEPMTYATALASLAAHTAKTSALTIAASSGSAPHLFNRIKRIMEMKKTNFSYSRAAAAILVVVAVTCSALWLNPSFAGPKTPATAVTNTANSEADLLIKRLTVDGLINADKGFLIEKKQDKLFINGIRLTEEAAAKYLLNIKRPNVSIRVYPYRYWQPKSISQKFLPPSMFPEIADTTAPGC